LRVFISPMCLAFRAISLGFRAITSSAGVS
jgi:hypothetical protein